MNANKITITAQDEGGELEITIRLKHRKGASERDAKRAARKFTMLRELNYCIASESYPEVVES